MRAAVLLFVLAGCRQIFGLHELATPPAQDSSDDSKLIDVPAVNDARIDALFDARPDAPPGLFRIGGTLYGLYGGSLGIRDNTTDNLTLMADGSFTFNGLLHNSDTYQVEVAALPPGGQSCSIENGTGTVMNADVTNIIASCRTADIMCATSGCTKQVQECCVGGTSHCQNAGQACPGAVLGCDDTGDCDQTMLPLYCCAAVTTGNAIMQSSCLKASNCPSNKFLCDPATGTDCPAGTGTCQPAVISGLPAGYFECR